MVDFIRLSKIVIETFKMSWQPYIDTNLLGSGKLTEAAILGHDGSVWAESNNIKVNTNITILDIKRGTQKGFRRIF